jgi:hypothetical protein
MHEHRRPQITRYRIWARENVITVVLSIFIILSMLLNALTIGAVYRVREVLRAQLETATRNLAEVRKQSLHYDFPVKQNFPISTSVQINETIDVPINMTVPIRQQITVPVGPVDFPVNLNFNVPISTTIPIKINRQVPIKTSIALDTNVPLELNLAQPPVGDILRRLQEALQALLNGL